MRNLGTSIYPDKTIFEGVCQYIETAASYGFHVALLVYYPQKTIKKI